MRHTSKKALHAAHMKSTTCTHAGQAHTTSWLGLWLVHRQHELADQWTRRNLRRHRRATAKKLAIDSGSRAALTRLHMDVATSTQCSPARWMRHPKSLETRKRSTRRTLGSRIAPYAPLCSPSGGRGNRGCRVDRPKATQTELVRRARMNRSGFTPDGLSAALQLPSANTKLELDAAHPSGAKPGECGTATWGALVETIEAARAADNRGSHTRPARLTS